MRALGYDYTGMVLSSLFLRLSQDIAERVATSKNSSDEYAWFTFQGPSRLGFYHDRMRVAKVIKKERIDVLLVHPGVLGQVAIFDHIPRKFPQLRLGLVSSGLSLDEYENGAAGTLFANGRGRLFDMLHYDKILDFVLERPS